MTRRNAYRALALVACVLAVWPRAAAAAVRIEEDEVVFTLDQPSAAEVYLVGDFNNWNPTLEKMSRVDGRFEVRLFLLEGTYRYKFVVDGKWIMDPDNPGRDPKVGSSFVLEERAGQLAFGSGKAAGVEGKSLITPSARYTGAFQLDDGDTRSAQSFDTWVSYHDKKLRSRADVRSVDASWSTSPLRSEFEFDRGFLELHMSNMNIKGFENDSLWASNDPFHLVGNEGVYDYTAGFGRKGFSVEIPDILHTAIRAVVTDRLAQRPRSNGVIAGSTLANFAAGSSPDTSAYAYERTVQGEDMWAIELAAGAGSARFGYVRRGNRGLHPGLYAGIHRTSGGFLVETYTSREKFNADVIWARWRFSDRFSVTGAYGRGDAGVRLYARTVDSVSTLGDIRLGQDTASIERSVPFQGSDRWRGDVEYEHGRWNAGATFEWNRFEFDAALPGAATADGRFSSLHARYAERDWTGSAEVRYADQDYGRSPADFHFDLPARNFWLDDRDQLTTARMAMFDHSRFTHVSGSVGWRRLARFRSPTGNVGVPFRAWADVDFAGPDVLSRVEYAAVRAGAERVLWHDVYLQGDVRFARYDKPSWQLQRTFVGPYIEVGYRRARYELSLGAGFDPVVLDPVSNEYADIGREERVRQAIPAFLGRGQTQVLGDGVRREENAIHDGASLIKLEMVLFF